MTNMSYGVILTCWSVGLARAEDDIEEYALNQKLKKGLNHRLDHIEILAFFVILFPVTLKILIETSNFFI